MHVLGRLTLAITIAGFWIIGCDGRGGSSGLDVNSENAAISEAISKNQCVGFQTLRICPTDQTTAGTPTITTPLANATSVDCFQAQLGGGACTFVLPFTATDFASDTMFQAFTRADGTNNPWVLGSPVMQGGQQTSFITTLTLSPKDGALPTQVQTAILAFAGSPSSPAQVNELNRTAASDAFVTEVLAVNVLTPTPPPTSTSRPTSTPTPTNTPGTNDCCQCPSSCAAPVNGACGNGCNVVFGTYCFGEQLCVLPTTTPTATPSPTPTSCFADNGDGTITDGCAGLMWEKKAQAAGLHDVEAQYPWVGRCNGDAKICQPDAASSAACAAETNNAPGCAQCPNGDTCSVASVAFTGATTTIWGWLTQLNSGQGFAGYTDWRIPTVGKGIDMAQWETLSLPGCSGGDCEPLSFNNDCDPGRECDAYHPCDPGEQCVTFLGQANTCQSLSACTVTTCSCTFSKYWSGTNDGNTRSAWVVAGDGSGAYLSDQLESVAGVRAVRVNQSAPTTACCQCPASCAAPVNGSCAECSVVDNAVCQGSSCVSFTPTPTPTPSEDCFTDNGDGTITDTCTNLVWEKKDEAGGLHDAGTLYTWAGACSDNSALCQPNSAASAACSAQTKGAVGCAMCTGSSCLVDPDHDGAATTIWDWLAQLNAAGLAGYGDWRIPSTGFDGGAAELESIFNTMLGSPCQPPILPIFNHDCTAGCSATACSCTADDFTYWSATTSLAETGFAYFQVFDNCSPVESTSQKTDAFSIRAVRTAK